jgi:hypothetical protein
LPVERVRSFDALDERVDPAEGEPAIDRRPVLGTGAHRAGVNLGLVVGQVGLGHARDGQAEARPDENGRADDRVDFDDNGAERDDRAVRDGRQERQLVQGRQQDERTADGPRRKCERVSRVG